MGQSDIIIKVLDASSPDWEQQLSVTDEMIERMECTDIPQIVVFNKCDLIDPNITLPGITVSAKTGEGLDILLTEIAGIISLKAVRGDFLLPFSKLSLMSLIRERGNVISEEYTEKGLVISCTVEKDIYHMLEEYSILEDA